MGEGRKCLKAYRVFYHISDEDDGSRWAKGAQQRGGPVKIALGPALAVERLG